VTIPWAVVALRRPAGLGDTEWTAIKEAGDRLRAASGITGEHASLAFDAVLLWGSWALRRLEPYIAGDPTRLVRELESEIFHRGKLAQRLEYANLPRLSGQDQRRIGVAVARRASTGTFVVAEEGVEAVHPEDEGTWPPAYVEGLVTGFFFDSSGLLDLDAAKVRESARLIRGLRDPFLVLRQLAVRLGKLESA
jgi:hypothetical protein